MRRTALRLAAAAMTASLVPLLPIGATPASASQLCTSAAHPALAARLSRGIETALDGRGDTVAIAVWDARHGVYCGYNTGRHFDSASVVKATIMGAVLRRAMDQHRHLNGWEVANLHAMITQSDNSAASALWASLGHARLQRFLRLAGMNGTVLGGGGLWGLTRIDARDELRLLDAYTTANGVLSPNSRAYGLRLMHQVISAQRWGTPYGTPPGVVWHVKNGWLPRATRGWRVHSLGVFTGSGRNYRMAVLTDRNPTMGYGIRTIERVALAIHRVLGSAR